MQETAEQRFVIRAIDWSTYRTISRALDGRHFHAAFDGTNLELMTVALEHGHASALISRLLWTLTEECEIPVHSCGDMTCESELVQRAIEPDQCFYLDKNESAVRGKAEIDLAYDPPPDLAVDVELTKSLVDRLAIYAALRIPEVWHYDGDTVDILHFDGKCVETTRSRYFPFVSGLFLARFLNLRMRMDDNSLVRDFRGWVKDQVGMKQ